MNPTQAAQAAFDRKHQRYLRNKWGYPSPSDRVLVPSWVIAVIAAGAMVAALALVFA